MSISGGVDNAILRGDSVGCSAVQIFTKNSNQWKSRPLNDEEIDRFHKNMKSSGISTVIAHDSYLINLASPDDVLRERSFGTFIDEMDRCRGLGIRCIVMHPGSHMGAGEEAGLKTISIQLKKILEKTEGWNVDIAIETTAGQGTNLGHRFEHLASIVDQVKETERIKVCFDTCHAFASGYDISTEEGYSRTMDQFERVIGIDLLVAFHMNDSKKEIGSRVDRHEHLGKGKIGKTCFSLIMKDARFADIPKIIETPKGKEMQEDRVNLAFLRGLVP